MQTLSFDVPAPTPAAPLMPPPPVPRGRCTRIADWEGLAVTASFSPRVMARRCGVSLRQLQRYFRNVQGLSLGDWLKRVRLNLAYRRLQDAEAVKEVAFDLGFKQVSHFSREFKATYGFPPKLLISSKRRNLGSSILPAPDITREIRQLELL